MRNIFAKGLIGVKYKDFCEAMTGDNKNPVELVAQPSRLIPIDRKNNEMSLTSVFLSSMMLVKEFRRLVSSLMKLSKGGSIYCYTEVSFPVFFKDDQDKCGSRFDGLAIVVTGGAIKDACVFEMKADDATLDREQIERYVEMCHKLKISRMMTVSNQFVPSETIYPIEVTFPKRYNFTLVHSSWMRIMSFAKILLQDNNYDIDDTDQQSIMREVLRYMTDCGSTGTYDRMPKEWKAVAEDLTGSVLNTSLKDQYLAVIKGWIEEEQSIAIALTCLLSEQEYTPVYADRKNESSLDKLASDMLDQVMETRQLHSTFKIKNAPSNLSLTANFFAKQITQSMTVQVPSDKTTKGKLSFIRNFLKKAEKANPERFDRLEHDIQIIIITKKKRDIVKFSLADFMDADNCVIGKDVVVVAVEINMVTDMTKRDMESPTKFVSILENQTRIFYASIMQYFEKWVPTTPKTKNDEEPIAETTPNANAQEEAETRPDTDDAGNV